MNKKRIQAMERLKSVIPKSLLIRIQKQFGASDIHRWKDIENIYEDWEERTEIMASWIPENSSVLEFGCARMVLKKHLAPGCIYTPSDIVDRGQGTLVMNLNEKPRELPKYDVFFFSGVLEYIHDLDWLLSACTVSCKSLIASYAISDDTPVAERRKHGWINDLTRIEFSRLLDSKGFVVMEQSEWRNQILVRADRQTNRA